MNHGKNLSPLERSRRSPSGQMQLSVFLYKNSIIALIFLFVWTADEIACCDTKWIRMVYMMTCGRKKRTSVWSDDPAYNYEELPSDFEEAFKYFKKRDPYNPMLNDSSLWTLTEVEENPQVIHTPKLLIYDSTENKSQQQGGLKSSSLFMEKLFPKPKNIKNLGIQGFPEQWDIEEIGNRKSDNYRRAIDRLMEECCKVPRVRACDQKLFSEAC